MLLEQFNAAPADEAEATLRACCDVPSWVDALASGRPYPDLATLLERADRAARGWTREDVDRAVAAHPRIGDRASGPGREAAWSRDEQAGVNPAATALEEGNRRYEERFGRVFLICATGLGTDDILAAMQARLANDDDTEATVVGEELRNIALLRLRKALSS